MKSVMSRNVVVAAAVMIALSAAVAQAQDTVHQLRAFHPTAQLLSGGSAVSASGPLGECPRGDELTLAVTVTQGGIAAKGVWPKPHPCTGSNQRWQLTVHTTGGSRLSPGQATGQGTVIIKRNGRTIARIRWHRTITCRRAPEQDEAREVPAIVEGVDQPPILSRESGWRAPPANVSCSQARTGQVPETRDGPPLREEMSVMSTNTGPRATDAAAVDSTGAGLTRRALVGAVGDAAAGVAAGQYRLPLLPAGRPAVRSASRST